MRLIRLVEAVKPMFQLGTAPKIYLSLGAEYGFAPSA